MNFAASTVRVTYKPDRNWIPKAYKERDLPILTKLTKKLKAWKARVDKTCGLVFTTSGCNPKLDFLDCLAKVLRGTGRARQGQLLAAQISFDVCDALPVGGSGFADGAAVAWAF